MTSSQPDEPTPPDQPDPDRRDDAAETGDAGRERPPFDLTFHLNETWRFLNSGPDRPKLRVAICSLRRADKQGPADLECYDMEAPSGSQPVEVRMRDLMAAMQLPSSAEGQPVHFTVIKSPLRRVQGKGGLTTNFPCYLATAPKYGKLVWVDTVEMFAVYMQEGDEEVELSPPANTRFIAVPSLEPARDDYLHLGIVSADGQWWRLYCPGLHVAPIQMDWGTGTTTEDGGASPRQDGGTEDRGAGTGPAQPDG